MCSYCGCQSISTIGRLMDEHVEITNATGELRRACESGDLAAARARCADVARLLDPHFMTEEGGLFDVMGEQEEFRGHIDGLCGEHGTLEELLDRIADGELGLAADFEYALREHTDKEDNGLFPAAAIALSGTDWERVVDQETAILGGAG